MPFLLAKVFVRFVELLFVVGLCGSAIVLVLTTFEDFGVLVHRDAAATDESLKVEA